MHQIVVVGGGYLGSMAGVLFSQNSDVEVTIIEKQTQLCGLYNTAHRMDGRSFDFGSRAILQTGVAEVDDVVFALLPDLEYPKTTDNLKEFSFQNGVLCEHSNCLDARSLPANIWLKGKAELLKLSSQDVVNMQFSDLLHCSIKTYGETYTKHLIEPAMRKLTGLELSSLEPNALQIHGLQRIIIADEAESRDLKSQCPFNDNRIAFSRYDNNKSSMVKTYPVRSGLTDYADRVSNYLHKQSNVNVLLGEQVVEISHNKNIVEALRLENGVEISCDSVFWTIPSAFFAKLWGMDLAEFKKPKFRNTILVHLIAEGELKTDGYYVYNYAPEFLSYRTTIYNNFCDFDDKRLSMTTEILCDDLPNTMESLDQYIFEEIKNSGLIDANCSLINANVQVHRNSWPSFMNGFFAAQENINLAAKGAFKNVYFAGKTNGKHHSGALVQQAKDIFNEMLV
jgi:protoporphyrinogen oxidase